jgi:hypothetical protein
LNIVDPAELASEAGDSIMIRTGTCSYFTLIVVGLAGLVEAAGAQQNVTDQPDLPPWNDAPETV